MTRQMLVKYRPLGAKDPKLRVEASFWSEAAGGGLIVIPLRGDRRYVHVRLKRGVYTEVAAE